jgi:MFS family permease
VLTRLERRREWICAGNEPEIPIFYAISNISYALFSWPAGRAADAWGTGKIIVIGYGFLILGYLVLVVSSSPAVLAVGFLLVGIFSAFTDGVQGSHLSRLAEDRYKGTAYGTSMRRSGSARSSPASRVAMCGNSLTTQRHSLWEHAS